MNMIELLKGDNARNTATLFGFKHIENIFSIRVYGTAFNDLDEYCNLIARDSNGNVIEEKRINGY